MCLFFGHLKPREPKPTTYFFSEAPVRKIDSKLPPTVKTLRSGPWFENWKSQMFQDPIPKHDNLLNVRSRPWKRLQVSPTKCAFLCEVLQWTPPFSHILRSAPRTVFVRATEPWNPLHFLSPWDFTNDFTIITLWYFMSLWKVPGTCDFLWLLVTSEPPCKNVVLQVMSLQWTASGSTLCKGLPWAARLQLGATKPCFKSSKSSNLYASLGLSILLYTSTSLSMLLYASAYAFSLESLSNLTWLAQMVWPVAPLEPLVRAPDTTVDRFCRISHWHGQRRDEKSHCFEWREQKENKRRTKFEYNLNIIWIKFFE